VLEVSRSGYYDWLKHKTSKRTQANQQLDEEINVIYLQNKKRYGSPRITRELQAKAVSCSHTRVARRMQIMNLKAVARKKYKVTTDSEHTKPIYNNILNRDFATTDINQKWCGDITYIPTKEGWLYLATVIDLHSRAVIGWAMSDRMKTQLVCDALLMALFKRRFPKGIIIHSDRGGQYCSMQHRKIIEQNELIGSMSRKGNCWDNAIAESFFHTLKVELIYENHYVTREEARQSIFQYIEGYYNQRRLHSSIDYRVPNEFEYAC
jgi:putative transposase